MYFSQHIFRRARSKTAIIQAMRIHKIVKVINPASKLQSGFNLALIMALQVERSEATK